MKLITFDIEEWYIEKTFRGSRQEKYHQFDAVLDDILKLLNETQTHATFFCLGKIAQHFPYVIRKIADNGHEIGCHSNEHTWLTRLTPETLRKDTLDAVASLEDVIGQKVISYRAPAFSITENNIWAIEVLAECGIINDASIFPAHRDFGGFPSFPTSKPCKIKYNGIYMNEYPIPICRFPLINNGIAYSGGGYFRLFPYWFISKQMYNNDYAMCYFHIDDLLKELSKFPTRQEFETYYRETGSLKNRIVRYIKSNIGSSNAFEKMEHIIRAYELSEIRSIHSKLPIIDLNR